VEAVCFAEARHACQPSSRARHHAAISSSRRIGRADDAMRGVAPSSWAGSTAIVFASRLALVVDGCLRVTKVEGLDVEAGGS